MQLIYLNHEPYLIDRVTKHLAICSPPDHVFAAQPGDFIMLDRWFNLVPVQELQMREYLKDATDE